MAKRNGSYSFNTVVYHKAPYPITVIKSLKILLAVQLVYSCETSSEVLLTLRWGVDEDCLVFTLNQTIQHPLPLSLITFRLLVAKYLWHSQLWLLRKYQAIRWILRSYTLVDPSILSSIYSLSLPTSLGFLLYSILRQLYPILFYLARSVEALWPHVHSTS